uniref:Putative secreted protein n=1 Tax=Ixodes ricinus TaxID=34613 RepID=A0A6B0UAZ2_IXORI
MALLKPTLALGMFFMSSCWLMPCGGMAWKTRASWLPFSATSCPSAVSSQRRVLRCSAWITSPNDWMLLIAPTTF